MDTTETVDVLTNEHRDRKWIDRSGDRWRWDEKRWRWQFRGPDDAKWIGALQPLDMCGPYTPAEPGPEPETVDALTDEHRTREWVDRFGNRWSWRWTVSRPPLWYWRPPGGGHWRSNCAPYAYYGPYTPAPAEPPPGPDVWPRRWWGK